MACLEGIKTECSKLEVIYGGKAGYMSDKIINCLARTYYNPHHPIGKPVRRFEEDVVSVEETAVLLAEHICVASVSSYLRCCGVFSRSYPAIHIHRYSRCNGKGRGGVDLHMGMDRAQIATCTEPRATNMGFALPDWTSQSKPLKVRAKEKRFLNTRRHVKPSTDMSPGPGLARASEQYASVRQKRENTYDAHLRCTTRSRPPRTPCP